MTDEVATGGADAPQEQTPVTPEGGEGGTPNTPEGGEQTPVAGDQTADAKQAHDTPPEGTDGAGDGDGEGDGAPDAYEPFEMPEGVTVDEVGLEKAAAWFKARGFKQEDAQEAVSLFTEVMADQAAQAEAKRKATVDGWQKETNENFSEEEIAKAVKVVGDFADDDLKSLLVDSGLGNHPAAVRMFGAIADQLASDDVIDGKNPAGEPKSREKILYPNT